MTSPLLKLTLHLIPVVVACVVAISNNIGQAQSQPALNLLKWNKDGSRIATIDTSMNVTIWDTIHNLLLISFSSQESHVASLDWNLDGTRLVTLNPENGRLRIWDTQHGEIVAELIGQRGFGSNFGLVRWSPNGRIIASATSAQGDPSELQFWTAEDDQYSRLPIGYGVDIYDLAWSPDGNRLAAAVFQGVMIFDDLNTDWLEPHFITDFKFALDWSPSGDKIAAIDTTGLIVILDTTSGTLLQRMQGIPRDEVQGMASVQWLPNNTHLAIYGFDGLLQIWDTVNGVVTESIYFEREAARNLLSISPYGGRLAVGGVAINVSQFTQLQTQIANNSVQSLAEGTMQIVVPDPSLERLASIAALCNAPLTLTEAIPDTTQADQLTDFVSQVEALPTDSIPPACAADLIAVAQAIPVGQ